jgi:spoIIIJ-associated protein
MEWVETTGKSIDEAKGRALDQLGVDEADAEFDVLEEPRAGLFGRVRGEARVRARVRPAVPRPKLERRDRKKQREARSSADAGAADAVNGLHTTEHGADAETDEHVAPPTTAPDEQRATGGQKRRRARNGQRPSSGRVAHSNDTAIEEQQEQTMTDHTSDRTASNPVDATQVGNEAAEFLRGLVDSFGLSGTVAMTADGDEIEVTVDGADLGLLVGPRGATLQAVQDLTRVAAQRRLGDHDTRLRVDVGGYRARRKEALSRFATQIADQVVSEGRAKRLEPMGSADRKIVHDALSDRSDVSTRSEGDDPNRFVVITPAAG